jgi:hypothetical protein
MEHLTGVDSKISGYWIDQLKKVERPIAKSLISQLVGENALGFDWKQGQQDGKVEKKRGIVFSLAESEKIKHPNKIILLRVGDFYECYGIDAVMLVAYAGLNPMGNKCRAGCPIKNIQATLDDLTEVGFSVAVFEETSLINDNKTKQRVLSQIVSPASRTYIYDLCLRSEDIEFKENRPAIGIMKTPASGYLIVQIFIDERAMIISERLTEEAIHSILSNSGAIDPIYIQDVSLVRDLPFLANHPTIALHGYSDKAFPKQVLHKIGSLLELDDTENFRVIHPSRGISAAEGGTSRSVGPVRPRPIYTSTALQVGLLPNDNVPDLIRYLLPEGTSMLGSSSTALANRFLRKWLLNPPPYEITGQMQTLCAELLEIKQSIPSFIPISIGKIISLLNAKQCNVALFRDIRRNVAALAAMLTAQTASPAPGNGTISTTTARGGRKSKAAAATTAEREQEMTKNPFEKILAPLLTITSYESGMRAEAQQLRQGCARVIEEIDKIISAENNHHPYNSFPSSSSSSSSSSLDACSKDPAGRIPDEFFKRNEEEFRNKISLNNQEIQALYREIDRAAMRLSKVIAEEIPEGISIQHDMMENAIMINVKPRPPGGATPSPSPEEVAVEDYADVDNAELEDDEEGARKKRKRRTTTRRRSLPEIPEGVPGVSYVSYIDRKRKVNPNKFTTKRLQEALNDYLTVVEKAPLQITRILQKLSEILLKDLVTIIHTSHFALILQSILLHTIAARQKGWTLPTLLDFPTEAEERLAMRIEGLRPYWLANERAITNDLEMKGLLLLTAPNMSGKSTLMRSVLVIALLANCGLFVPATSAKIPKFETFFLRTASYDVPSEAKSAFALEMDDIRIILRDGVSASSLIMIDELGKGTSSRDGASLAGSLLEYLSQRRVYGIFATHLHELFRLPLQLSGVENKRMGFTEEQLAGDEDDEEEVVESLRTRRKIRWTYQLEDGICEDSMALVTAENYAIPSTILDRAKQLMNFYDRQILPANHTASLDDENDDPSHDQQEQRRKANRKEREEREEDEEGGHHVDLVDERPRYLETTILPLIERFSKEFLVDETLRQSLSQPLLIPAGHNVPPFVENQSVLYLLHIYSPKLSPVSPQP